MIVAPKVFPISHQMTVAFTWSPANICQRIDPQDSFKLQIEHIRLLRLCCDKVDLYPEMFLNGGLHWHGTLHITDKIKWYKKILPNFRKHGMVVVKSNPDETWNRYQSKEWIMMQELLNIPNIDTVYVMKKKGKRDTTTPILTRPVTMESFLEEELPVSSTLFDSQSESSTTSRYDFSKV